MVGNTGIRNELYRLYEHYVGEPDSAKDVYGYWLFIVGYVVGAAGIFAFIVGYAGDIDSLMLIRISGVMAASGLSVLLFGIVLMLPVRKRGIQASAVGLVIALVGVGFFAAVYPSDWYEHGADYSVEVTAVYATGIAIIAGVTALVPIITGQKGKFVEEEGVTDEPAILTGDSLEAAQFAVFRDEAGDWKWHILHLEALAASEGSTINRPETEASIERVKSQIGSAGLMELTTSAFRLYEDREGTWQWTLVRDDGSVVGACAQHFPDRDGAEQSVSFLKDRGPDADVIEIDGAAFTYVEERDEWYWQLLDDDRLPLASSETGYFTQSDAEEAAQRFAARFDQARLLDLGSVGVELRERDDGGESWWFWRFVDEHDEVFAESSDEFPSRRDAEEAVEALLPELESASITVAGEPTYELYQVGERWSWRLIDETEHRIAEIPGAVENESTANEGVGKFRSHAEAADVVEIEDAEYEIYPTEPIGESGLPVTADDDEADSEPTPVHDGGVETEEPAEPTTDWNWRLVTEDREVVAASNEPHDDPETATEAIDRVREQAREADLIEFENAAFQVYEADSGEWRWRLIDEDGNVLADSGEEHTSRGDAAQAMMTLKEQAPDAELLEIDTAAFELFVDEDGEWGWRLIDEGGKLVAEDPATHPTRAAAKAAMDRLLEHLESDVRTMDRAIFQTIAEEAWHWQFVLPSGEVVAVDAEAHATRDELVESIPAIKGAASAGRSYTIGDVAVQLYGTGEWGFRLLDRDRELLADSTVTYADRASAMTAAQRLERNVADAPVFSIEDAAIRLTSSGGWGWELVDRDREVLAGSVEAEPTKENAIAAVEEIRRLAPLAGRVDFDVASFELFAEEEDCWRWRLIDEDGRTVATGAEEYASSDRANQALAGVRELIGEASILEIDSVSFELHAAEGGWKWSLVDKYGVQMSESTQVYETRTAAREAMNAVKAHAPDGWITFTE
ncbi:DUF1508 domain-containing protein [Natronobiforma cellulositropha]|uniref:DUF1508 domain-containing protein n=1 Tax=Natronobiforma cellulositropha TaxID=1679076 RepID=UPI0021D57653|nr:DUF1508 domain-containing protein [Natronobiforma cellulositropha]